MEDRDGSTDDFGTDAVAGDGGDVISRIRGGHNCSLEGTIFLAGEVLGMLFPRMTLGEDVVAV